MIRTAAARTFAMRTQSLVHGVAAGVVVAISSTSHAAPGAVAGGGQEGLLRSSLGASALERLRDALGQFMRPAAWIELLLGIGLALVLAALIAFHPRGRRRPDAVHAMDERKTLVILGLIGAVVAALVVVDQAMALVVLGLGALIRFRTLIATPNMNARAILVIAIGLACGLTQYLLAIVVALAAWLLIWWIQARRTAEVKIRLLPMADRAKAELVASLELRSAGCHVRSLRPGKSGRSFTMGLQAPEALDDEAIRRRLETRLIPEVGAVEIETRSAT
jgi:hypothetical protein